MSKKGFIVLLVSVLAFVCDAFAQEVHTDWYDVDSVVVYQTVDIADYQAIVLLPIGESGLEFSGNDDELAAMRKAIDEFRDLIKIQFNNSFPHLDVIIADAVPSDVPQNTLVMKMDIPDFGQGSRAARAWGGFGAGAQHTDLCGECLTATNEKVFWFTQHRANSAMGQLSNKYYNVMVRTERVLGNDICNIFNAMAGSKPSRAKKR